MATPMDLSELEADPRLFLYTSLTAGSSHIITATSRLETILKANKIPFQAIDTATDEKARRLWGRRAGKRKLPGLVKEGYVIGDLEEVEEWNEFGELKENVGTLPPAQVQTPQPAASSAIGGSLANSKANLPMRDAGPQAQPAEGMGAKKVGVPTALVDASKIRPLPGTSAADTRAGAEAAAGAGAEDKKDEGKSALQEAEEATRPETMNTAAKDKEASVRTAAETATMAAGAGTSVGGTEAKEDAEAVTTSAAADVSGDKANPGTTTSETTSSEQKGSEAVSSEKQETEAADGATEHKTVDSEGAQQDAASKSAAVEPEQTIGAAATQTQEPASAEDATKSVED